MGALQEHAVDGEARSPVLSEQMAVAPPIVSQAASTRTKLLSFIICFMLHVSTSRSGICSSHGANLATCLITCRTQAFLFVCSTHRVGSHDLL